MGRALAFCPKLLFQGADIVRKLRNDFAHNLQMRSFSDIPGRMQALRDYLLKITPAYPKETEDTKICRDAIGRVVFGLEMYRPGIQLAMKMLRSGDEEVNRVMSYFYKR
jgi:hypothetical protein